MLRIKKDKKKAISLSHGISLGFTPELALALTLVVFFHLLFYLAIDTQETVKSLPIAKNKAMTLIVSNDYEEDDLPVKVPISKELGLAILNESMNNTQSLLTNPTSSIAKTGFFEETRLPLNEWLDALEDKDPIFKSAPRYYPKIECKMLGDLATLKLPKEKLIAWDESATRYQCIYEVCIEGESGLIVFSRHIDGDVPSSILKKAEDYLHGLKFSASMQTMIKGHVEIIITATP